ncbi:MAG: gamma-glutamyltransferase [Alphaproteobacteria bacterium]|nr:gamma-glutamyltransferase [Alphaproteobacteria bacterium]
MRRWPLVLAVALLPLGPVRVAQAEPQQMVAAAHPMAVEAGLEVLARGGTAVDAAVAVQMMLGVVEPQASGIGGGGFLLYYDGATRAITVYDGREAAPAGAKADMFLGPDGKPLPFRDAVESGLSVGVPGAVALLERAQKEHGKLAWPSLFTTSIAAARNGVPVSPRLAAWLGTIRKFADEPQARAIYFKADGAPKIVGDPVVNTALADTMGKIAATGSVVLRQGPIADEMVKRVATHVRPGTLSQDDLAHYEVMTRAPLCGLYRVWTICGMGPPSSGGLAILQVLKLLEPFELSHDRPNDLRSLHLVSEASRLAFADRARYVGDPAFVDVPTEKLLAPAYIDQRRKLISTERSMDPPGGPVPPGYVEHGTSHMTIVDKQGNAVSFTTTIESPFGALMMVGGFILNNELTDFTAVPVFEGRPVANRVEPGKRPRSSMSPTFVLNADGGLVAAVGSAGGARIIGDTLQTLVGMLDWNLSAQAAIDLPRILNMNGPTELEDKGDLPALADRLRALGHDVKVRAHEGGLTAIRREGDGWGGGADPRRDGVARGD